MRTFCSISWLAVFTLVLVGCYQTQAKDFGSGATPTLPIVVSITAPTATPTATRTAINVDSCGANPFDNNPDSDAIQKCIDQAKPGDQVIFSSGVNNPRYKGYLIDKTIYLVDPVAKANLTFTSSDLSSHALLRATADLKGPVVGLFPRSRIHNPGDIDNITFRDLDVDGGQDTRLCTGSNGIRDGRDDNWGSWLPECGANTEDPYCNPANISLTGAMDDQDPMQDYMANPSKWSTGFVVENVGSYNTECGTALAMLGAAGMIRNVTILSAGHHFHAEGCPTVSDGDVGEWTDGITLNGPGHIVTNNIIINPSDVAIAFFGGKNTVISNNVIRITSGNYGAFGGITIHTWTLGDITGDQIIGNTITNEGNALCGGLHVGIQLGPQMWGGACVSTSTKAMIGNSTCSPDLPSPKGAACTSGTCQLWAYVSPGGEVTLKGNTIAGAQINYMIEGLDLEGKLVDTDNVSVSPRITDWGAAKTGCSGITWGAFDRMAHSPSLPGWTDIAIYCER